MSALPMRQFVTTAIRKVREMRQRIAVPIVVLIIALGGVARFAQGLRLVDTIGLLTSGALAGSAMAQLAAVRRR